MKQETRPVEASLNVTLAAVHKGEIERKQHTHTKKYSFEENKIWQGGLEDPRQENRSEKHKK